MDENKFRDWLNKSIHREGSQKEFAESRGIDRSVLSLVATGVRKPSDGLLDTLGFERVVTYRPKPKENQQ